MSVGEFVSTTLEVPVAPAEAAQTALQGAEVLVETPTESTEAAALPASEAAAGIPETLVKLPLSHPLRQLQEAEAAERGPNRNASRFFTYF